VLFFGGELLGSATNSTQFILSFFFFFFQRGGEDAGDSCGEPVEEPGDGTAE